MRGIKFLKYVPGGLMLLLLGVGWVSVPPAAHAPLELRLEPRPLVSESDLKEHSLTGLATLVFTDHSPERTLFDIPSSSDRPSALGVSASASRVVRRQPANIESDLFDALAPLEARDIETALGVEHQQETPRDWGWLAEDVRRMQQSHSPISSMEERMDPFDMGSWDSQSRADPFATGRRSIFDE